MRGAAYEIINAKGYTSFGIATAIVRLCEAVIRDENAVLPVSTLMTGQLGVDGIYLSMPCVLGSSGVARVLVPELSEEEQAGVRASAAVIGEVARSLPIPAI